MNVFIIGGGVNYHTMFKKLGFTPIEDLNNADLVCFTGGADVSPEFYGEEEHLRTHSDLARDFRELDFYRSALLLEIPMVGICRGGQFLHVMNGGKLYQHVDHHAIGDTHYLSDIQTGEQHSVTSTHHQMMAPRLYKDKGLVVATAQESVWKEHVSNGEVVRHLSTLPDIEVMWYEDTDCLCFQPHPELEGAESTYLYFKNLLTRFNLTK